MEPLGPLNFENLWKIDLYIDLYIDITSGTSRTFKFQYFGKRFLLDEFLEPLEPLNFVVLRKIDLCIDLYIDITYGT